MAEFTGYIYSIVNEINGHVYIGKTHDLVRRWKEHYYGHGKTAILNKAFKKYGLEHFIFEIVAQIPFDNIDELNEVLNQLEIYYIHLYDSHKNGYNATIGGDGICGYKQSKETTEKIRKANIGRVVSEETKAKISAGRKGIGHSEEAKKKITNALLNRDRSIYEKIAMKRRGVKRDPEMIMRGAVKRRKPILQYDMNGNFIKEYPGIKFVEGFENKNISACCHGKLLSTQGYMWKFKDSEDFSRKIAVPDRWRDRKVEVCQLNKAGELIAEYSSLTEAAKAVGTTASKICQCLKGTQKTTKGFMWKYKERKEVNHAL